MKSPTSFFIAAICGLLMFLSGNVFAQYYYNAVAPAFVPCSNYPYYNCANPAVTTYIGVPAPVYFYGGSNFYGNGFHGNHFNENHGGFHGGFNGMHHR